MFRSLARMSIDPMLIVKKKISRLQYERNSTAMSSGSKMKDLFLKIGIDIVS
jgi:hypothetical protein